MTKGYLVPCGYLYDRSPAFEGAWSSRYFRRCSRDLQQQGRILKWIWERDKTKKRTRKLWFVRKDRATLVNKSRNAEYAGGRGQVWHCGRWLNSVDPSSNPAQRQSCWEKTKDTVLYGRYLLFVPFWILNCVKKVISTAGLLPLYLKFKKS